MDVETLDDDLAGFIDSLPVVAQDDLDGTTTRTTTSATIIDFRVEFNCQKGNHYAKQMRGRGSSRRKNSGKEGQSNYEYLGIASVVAQRGGYFEQRWLEYSFNHACNYVEHEGAGKATENHPAETMGDSRLEDGV